ALESIAYQTVDVIRAMEADSRLALKELRVDGGATANDLLMQFQADVLGVPVVRPRVRDATALSAAYLAGLAVGFWADQDEIATQWAEEAWCEPQRAQGLAAAQLEGWARALEGAKAWEDAE